MTDALAAKAADPKAVLTGSSPTADDTEGMSYLQIAAAPAGDALSAAVDHPA